MITIPPKIAVIGSAVLIAVSTGVLVAQRDTATPAVKGISTTQSKPSSDKQPEQSTPPATPVATTTPEQSSSAASNPTAPSAKKQTTTTTEITTPSKPVKTAPTPAPAPTSFETVITRNGQVSPGTMIYYSAAKGEKGFYAGDLIISRPNITISRSAYSDTSFIVTIPDSQVSGAPSAPWNDTNKSTYAVYDQSPTSGTSWKMLIQLGYGAANGTYTVHLTSSRAAQTTDGWYYHGFMTVTVVD